MTPPTWWPRVDGAAAGPPVAAWGELADGAATLARIWLPSGPVLEVVPLAFGVRLALVNPIIRESYEDVWCYRTLAGALAAAIEWDGAEGTEPQGWHRHPTSGRRRPNGNAALEEVRY